MIGYHYTTYSNWREIQGRGLVPQTLDRSENEALYAAIQRILGDKRRQKTIRACWVWEKRQIGEVALGHILMIHKHHPSSKRFVELMVEFDEKRDTLQCPRNAQGYQNVQIYHNGTLDIFGEKFSYHESEPVKLVTSQITPKAITQMRTFNLKTVLRQLVQ